MANLVTQAKGKLATTIENAIDDAIAMEELDLETVPEIMLEVPREEEHGDYATNVAMVLAGQAKMAPRDIAQIIVNNLKEADLIDKVEVAGPGFINFHLNNNWLYQTIELALNEGEDYGKSDFGQGKKVQIEFVSANPTGPLHVGHSRGAIVGDVLGNIMLEVGFDITKEYYINDAGNQMDLLGKSVALRYQQLNGEEVELPENAYHGEYIKRIANDIFEEYGEDYLESAKQGDYEFFREYAYEELLANIKRDLAEFGIEFDNWFSERKLHTEDKIEDVVKELKTNDYIYEQEGALWFKSTDFGDDKDRVVIKADGTPTYLAADIAYHNNKYQRGFEEVINIWGADHHGYIARMKAVVEALGYDREMLRVIIVQMVTLLREGQQISMSKRAGNFVTLKDVVEEVGRDAARYFYIMRSTDSHLDFDLELAKEESTENPVYYIQYAYARICSILEQLETKEIDVDDVEEVNLEKLATDVELDLIQELAKYPDELEKSAESRAPHHMARYAHELAAKFHSFYNKCRVLIDDIELMQARIKLVLATQQVLSNLLRILGISAPENM
ncbi:MULTISPECIES: arginine--tRNA ligase [unclassified Candidatus Frackibacter]|uniref:arginine--tRNA ligase n=1 Tax=unclassified Candidatus Frackibacter TaxID=2648818 RepID=UPI00088D5FB3|nr:MULTISPECIES: arginine--tRNA ligase [unclassified Candidatus Frackibacter]SDC11161.1 arginyl-tRNA synthetase [Candidatus Frackibacter sp. WG11]SEM36657.1 arginyl-tRNA synthetase [Candidatus Frackibacter sp. WG12]SFL41989.1 arginyl-tRNA synthetase [Candidatus Frackibacter sp. WG13]